jgi:putative component of toxin-antitoxin plasmid stabilization module
MSCNRSITISDVLNPAVAEFTVWLDGLNDETVHGAIVARIQRLHLGLMADV